MIKKLQKLAQAGLRYVGERRDLIWGTLRELDLMREAAKDPENPGIRIDSPAQRELREVFKTIPSGQIATRDFAPPLETKEEIIRDPYSRASTMLFLARSEER